MNIVSAFLKLNQVAQPFLLLLHKSVQVLCFEFLFTGDQITDQLHCKYKTFIALVLFVWFLLQYVLQKYWADVINDYFDVNIDLINKPAKLIVDRYIKRRWTIVWHIVLSFIGLLLG